MYESPIEIINIAQITEQITREASKDFKKQIDDSVYQAVLQCGIKVDKEKLLEALNHSYAQYHIGYAEGFKVGAEKLGKRLKEELAMHDEILLTIDQILFEMGVEL